MNTDQYYMQRCLELAQKAKEEGESAIGSIVILEGKIIGEAYEMSRQLKDVTRHAEVLAILDALKYTDDLLAISDESTEHEIAKLTDSLNADEQKELMNDYIVQNFFDLESYQQNPKFIMKFLSLHKISGD